MNLSSDPIQRAREHLDRAIHKRKYPGIQYIASKPNGVIFQYFGGLADIRNHRSMLASTTMMAYSMTKTFTAAAVLQLVEANEICLDESVSKYFPSIPYGRSITIRHLLSQTSGIPNPIPLRWVHSVRQRASFDERQALKRVLQKNPKLIFTPGNRYRYSNISYWILGQIMEYITGETFPTYIEGHIFQPLHLSRDQAHFAIPDVTHHAKGYLGKYTIMNLVKPFLIDPELVGEYEDGWLHIRDHYPNGASFGGLIATAQAISVFLRDQLSENSTLFNRNTGMLFFSQQKTTRGEPINMTLGWHIGRLDKTQHFYKEGGGGGYHAEMRIYPVARIATVIMVNETSSRCVKLQDQIDRGFVLEHSTDAD
jgi:D-alanyl-D-alanine carboxypeptidase